MFPAVRLNKVIRQVLMTLTILVACIIGWLYIAPSKPAFLQKKCPPVLGKSFTSRQKYGDIERPVDCSAVFEATPSELEYASTFKWCRRSDAITDKDYLDLTANCDTFLQHGRYNDYEITKEEKDFPLAFSIIMHENVEQMERLLRVIYRPQNVYCVHLDARASLSLHQALHGISGCFSNVIIPKRPIKVEWSEFSVLEAELICMRELWKQKYWKYFINLTGREYPLKTNLELVQILKAYDGANDIDGSPHKRPIIWTKYVWWNENWRTSRLKSPPPDGFVISKGSTHIAATRGFVDYALHDNRSHDLLEWMRDIRVPDEHFFATLNHNPHLDVPGSYKGDPDLKYFYTRLKIWQSKEETCTGRWFRFICQFGVADLWRLPKAKQLFVNKFHQEMDPIAFDCVEQWYRNKTKTMSKLDIDFYRNLDFVKNHLKG